jgi:polyisoprenoid-binding protein YceI
MALSARVRTRDGWAVAQAVVTLADMSGTQVLRVEADEEGLARDKTPLDPGWYTVIVTAPGYAPAASTAIVSASGRVEVGTIQLARHGGYELPPSGTWTIDPAHSTVIMVAQHLGMSSVQGRFKEFAGRIEIARHDAPDKPQKIEDSQVSAVIQAASIDTGNIMRDDHLRSGDFFDIKQYPDITYQSSGLVPAGPDRWTVRGELGLHGYTRPVDLDLTYLGTNPDPWGGFRAAFVATTELHREDFAIDWNQIVKKGLGLIGTTIHVELNIQAVHGDEDALPTA